jgi:hypothetical protein
MRNLGFLAILVAILGGFQAVPAQADPPLLMTVPPIRQIIFNNFFQRSYNTDFDARLLEGPKHPHNNQWDNSGWTPEGWAEFYGDKDTQIKHLVNVGILTDLSDMDDDDVAEIEVGHAFVRLSGQEKRRVVEYVDYAYGFTQRNPDGTILIQYDPNCDYIGIYTKNGLQLQ